MNEMSGEVGYKRPPAEHRWKKGQSGNPRGSKPGDGFFEAAVNIFAEVMPPAAGLKKKSAYALICMRLCVAAIKGDNRILFDMINLILQHEAEAKKRSASRFIDWEGEAAKFKAQLMRLAANHPSPPTDKQPRKRFVGLTAAEKREINRKAKRMWKEEKQQREERVRNRGY